MACAMATSHRRCHDACGRQRVLALPRYPALATSNHNIAMSVQQVSPTVRCNIQMQQSDATSRYNQSVQQVGATVRRNNDSLPVTVLPVSRTFQSAIQSRVYSINDGSPFDRWPVLGWSPAMQLVEAQVTPTWAPVGEDW